VIERSLADSTIFVAKGQSMKPLYLKVVLFDPTLPSTAPIADREFPVFDGLEVEIIEIQAWNPNVGFDSLRLRADPGTQTFVAENPAYEPSRDHFIRVGFAKPNFSKRTKSLLAPEDVSAAVLPIYCPVLLPYWDTGWQSNYEINKHFDDEDVTIDSSRDKPYELKIPMRQLFNIGHRGAPHRFPENSIASFKAALDLGANGLEFDLCLTRDDQIVIFHDAQPVKLPPHLDRTIFEDLPYELVSPVFRRDNGRTTVLTKEFQNGRYVDRPESRLESFNQYDIINLTLAEVRQNYHYALVNGIEHPIPTLEEFLQFVSAESNRLRFLFFDMKYPVDGVDRNLYTKFGRGIGRRIAAQLRQGPLPEYLVICNPNEEILGILRENVRAETGDRCLFAYDAAGGVKQVLGGKKNPLSVARRMGNKVVSIGHQFRPGDFDEIKEAVNDRDYEDDSPVELVIHWTLNDPTLILQSYRTGVNGVLTDKADELARLLGRLKVRVV
jgi:glycerophosphoryl diester phosphodiesterase